jgi:predicted kinase
MNFKMSHTPTLHLVCGQAGAGKTTYAKHLEKSESAVRFSKDEWIITLYGRDLTLEDWSQFEPRCYALIESISEPLLKRGISIIWDYGFWYREERLKALSFANNLRAHCKLHYLATETELRRDRVLDRNRSLTHDSVAISAEEFDKQLGWFEVPSEDEGVILKVIRS